MPFSVVYYAAGCAAAEPRSGDALNATRSRYFQNNETEQSAPGTGAGARGRAEGRGWFDRLNAVKTTNGSS